MARHNGPVLVDTNVILECWRADAWKALAGGYQVETVEDCVIETQTGFQRRRDEQQIDNARLRASLAAVQKVGDAESTPAIAVRDPLFSSLDRGEQSLWAHALTRKDDWVSLRSRQSEPTLRRAAWFRERLVALESLLGDVGFKPKYPLRTTLHGQMARPDA